MSFVSKQPVIILSFRVVLIYMNMLAGPSGALTAPTMNVEVNNIGSAGFSALPNR